MAREIDDIIDRAIDQGWRVRRLKSGHIMFLPPDKNVRPLVTGGTPSDRRALNNIKADLKRHGLRFDGVKLSGLLGGLLNSGLFRGTDES